MAILYKYLSLSNILSQIPYLPFSTTIRKFQHIFSIYVGNYKIKPIFPTYFSNILFTNEEGVLSHPFRLLNLLPTPSSHLLLYPLTDTPQEMFQYIHSIDGKLPHKIICFFNLLLKRSVLSFQFLILTPDQISGLCHCLLH